MAEFHFIGTAALLGIALDSLKEGVEQCAEDLAGLASAAETAVVSGTLKGSIQAGDAEISGNEITARVFTGGESGAYAAYIHEGHRADGSHEIAAYPGGLKFIERPLIENRPVYLEVIARSARGAF